MTPRTATAERPPKAVDPRIEQRRAAVRRRQSRRRVLPWLVAALVLALAVDAWMVLHSRFFAVRQVQVTGAVHLSAGQVQSAADLWSGPALLTLDTGAVAARVERLPWVDRATVVRQWPDTVRISVTERVPVAQLAVAGGFVEVDRTGRVLGFGTRPFPVVSLAGGPRPVGGAVTGGAEALQVAATLPKAFVGQVLETVEGADGQVSLVLTSPVTVQLGQPTELRAKYEDVAAILAGATLHPGDVIDVSVPDSPIVTGG